MKPHLHQQGIQTKREREKGSKISRWHRWSINCLVHFADTRFLANQREEKRRQRTTVAGIPDFRTRRTTITQSTEHEHPRRDLATFSCDDTELVARFPKLAGRSRANSANRRWQYRTRKNTNRRDTLARISNKECPLLPFAGLARFKPRLLHCNWTCVFNTVALWKLLNCYFHIEALLDICITRMEALLKIMRNLT